MGVIEISRKRLEMNLDKIMDWTPDNVLGDFRALVKSPPLRSVVADIYPEAAAMLIREANTKNRPLSKNYLTVLSKTYDKSADGVTGDTIKFGKSGRLIDGQHRLWMASRSSVPFRTHVVFGINDEAFDIIDQGRKRTAGDVLAVDLIPNAIQTASAARWVFVLSNGVRADTATKATVIRNSPRGIRKLVMGELSHLPRYAVHGQRVSRAFGYPAGMVQAVCYLISTYDAKHAAARAHHQAPEQRPHLSHDARRVCRHRLQLLAAKPDRAAESVLVAQGADVPDAASAATQGG